MPRRHAEGETPEEELAHLLDALGPRMEDLLNKDVWQVFMKKRFAEDPAFGTYRDLTLERTWGMVSGKLAYQAEGFRFYTYKTQWGTAMRFGIKGVSGSFGFKRAREIFTERTGRIAPF